MSEAVAVAGFLNDTAGNGIKVLPCYAGFCRFDSSLLRPENDAVDLAHFLVRLTDADRSGHIAVIAVIYRAEVHKHELSALNLLFRGDSVRHRGVRAGKNYRLKGEILRALFKHKPVELEGNAPLGDALPDKRQQLVKSRLSDLLCLSDAGELLGVLDHSHIRNRIAESVRVVNGHLSEEVPVSIQFPDRESF